MIGFTFRLAVASAVTIVGTHAATAKDFDVTKIKNLKDCRTSPSPCWIVAAANAPSGETPPAKAIRMPPPGSASPGTRTVPDAAIRRPPPGSLPDGARPGMGSAVRGPQPGGGSGPANAIGYACRSTSGSGAMTNLGSNGGCADGSILVRVIY